MGVFAGNLGIAHRGWLRVLGTQAPTERSWFKGKALCTTGLSRLQLEFLLLGTRNTCGGTRSIPGRCQAQPDSCPMFPTFALGLLQNHRLIGFRLEVLWPSRSLVMQGVCCSFVFETCTSQHVVNHQRADGVSPCYSLEESVWVPPYCEHPLTCPLCGHECTAYMLAEDPSGIVSQIPLLCLFLPVDMI